MRGVLAGLAALGLAAVLPAASAPRFSDACPGFIESFAFSPSGRWIAYTSHLPVDANGNARDQLDIVRTDGRAHRTILRQNGDSWRWAPRGDRLAVLAGSQGTARRKLLIVDPSSPLVRVRALGADGFEWSPTGTWIVVMRGGDLLTGHLGEPGLYLLAKDTYSVTWSPDGRWLAFDQRGDVVLAHSNGSAEHVLTSGFGPQWSPDGKWVLIFREGEEEMAFVVHRDGFGLRPVFTGTSMRALWSPDGQRIAFMHPFYSIIPWDPPADVVDVRTRETWSLGLGRVAWSPTGQRLVLWRRYREPKGLFVMSPDGSGSKMVGTAGSSFGGWSPDGRQFILWEDNTLELVRDDGKGTPRPFANGQWAVWSPDGTSIAYVQQQRVPCGQVLLIKSVRGGKPRALARCG